MTSGFDDDFFGGRATPFEGAGLDDAELLSMFRPGSGYAPWLLGFDRKRRQALLDAHIERRWAALPEQSKRRLGVLAASTGTAVSPEEHLRLIGALGLIAEAEGTLAEEAEFAETYLSTDWVCRAVAEAERTRCLPKKEKEARRREQTRLAVARHRDRSRSEETEKARKKRAAMEESLAAAASGKAIAIDGEGVTLDDGSHVYRYMAACLSDGTVLGELENDKGIGTREAVQFLAALPKRDRDGIPFLGVFGYGLGYDWTKMLERLMNKPLYDLFHSDDLKPKARVGDCKLLLIGKCVEITDGRAPKSQKKTKVWDILKGFQSTFVKALRDWDVGSEEVWQRIEDMKKQRGKFKDVPWEEVKTYCKDECQHLAELVETYVRAHVEAGIDLRGKYHGAGSTSDAFLMMMDALNKKCTRETDGKLLDDVQRTRSAFSRAFFGGRAEVSRLGIVRGPVWTVDIASAYPHVLYTLPCVKHGKWRNVSGRGLRRALGAAKVAVVRHTVSAVWKKVDDPALAREKTIEDLPSHAVDRPPADAKKKKLRRQKLAAADVDGQDDVPELQRTAAERSELMKIEGAIADAAWGPLPYRTDKGSIVFPTSHPGGWAWLPEFRAAEQHGSGVTAHEAWVLRGSCQCARPYEAIGQYYMLRIEWDAQGPINPTTGKPSSGRGKVLKLGYNGVYGKTAQVIGKNPKYSCRVVAGHITGSTRGRLFEAISSASDPWNVIYGATDGLIATEPLDPPNPPENETTAKTKKWLGVWEIEKFPDDLFIVQPGFYFSLAPKGKARTRGTPLEIIYAYRDKILEQWQRHPTRKPRGLPKQSTFHGCKSSIRPPTKDDAKYRRDRLYGRWTEEHRKINYVVSPKRSSLFDQGDGSYRLSTWWMDPTSPESCEYKKDPSFKKLDDVNDEQPDYVEPLVRGVGEMD